MKLQYVAAVSYMLGASALAFQDYYGPDVTLESLYSRDVYHPLVRRGRSRSPSPARSPTPTPGNPKVTPSGNQIFKDPADNQIAMNIAGNPKDPNSHAASVYVSSPR